MSTVQVHPKIISFVICEIARKEVETGKDLLVGVYPKSFNVSALPAVIPNFAIWLEVSPSKLKSFEMNFAVFSPNKKLMIQGKGGFETSDSKSIFGLPIQMHNLIFKVEGNYIVKCGFDGTLKKIGEFTVSAPSPQKTEEPPKPKSKKK